MNKEEARKQLLIGYLVFAVAVFIGFTFVDGNECSPFLIGYLIWSTFWGYKLSYFKLKNFGNNSPVNINSKNSFDYLMKNIKYKWVSELLIFTICYIVGNMGRGIYMQIMLSKKAYF
jgi:hypothetical protein